MKRVLVHIPSSVSNTGASIRFTAPLDRAQDLLSEGRIDRNSTYHGAAIVPNEQLSIHRFVLDKAGNPIQDPDSLSLTKAELQDHDAKLERVEEADVSTVGDMADQLARMQEMMASMKDQLHEKEASIIAKDRKLQAQQDVADTLGKTVKDGAASRAKTKAKVSK